MHPLENLCAVLLVIFWQASVSGASWEAVRDAIDDFEQVPEAVVWVSRAGSEAPVFTHTKGSTWNADSVIDVLSASKWLSAAAIMSVVDQGHISLSDRVGDHLAFWTSEASDQRSGITLEHLLSFTAGLNGNAEPCARSSAVTFDDCVQTIYKNNDPPAYTPGSTYSYGLNSMQVAAAMAISAMPNVSTWAELMQSQVFSPLGLTGGPDLMYNQVGNPRIGGGFRSSMVDYNKFLRAYFLKAIPSAASIAIMEEDHTPSATVASPGSPLPSAHYGLGNWIECPWSTRGSDGWSNQTCIDYQVSSSGGGYGFYPWVDRKNGYYAFIGRDVKTPSGAGMLSIDLGKILQPLIAASLTDGATTAPTQPPTEVSTDGPTAAVADPWEAVRQVIDTFPGILNAVVKVSSESAPQVFSHTKGSAWNADSVIDFHGSSQLLTAAVIMSVVDQGHISLSDRVGDHLAFWTSEASDQRSGITLEHLLSFTSGLNAPDGGTAGAYDPCTLSSTMSLGVCAQAIYDNNRLSSSPPGTRFVYGRNHLVVAAAMVVEATPGVASWDELLQTQVLAPLGTDLQYLPIGNPDLLNGLRGSMAAYDKIIHSIFNRSVVSASSVAAMEADHTPTASVGTGFSPLPSAHYGLGLWLECPWSSLDPRGWEQTECSGFQVYSCGGAFGFWPWFDRGNGYYAWIGYEDKAGGAFAKSLELAGLLKPLIATALGASTPSSPTTAAPSVAPSAAPTALLTSGAVGTPASICVVALVSVLVI